MRYGYIYDDFCRESRCATYQALSKLKSILDPSVSTIKDIKMIKTIRCQENCEHTAYELREWLKINEFKYHYP